MIWNQDNIQQATKAEVFGNWQAEGVCIDTRKLKAGDLFVAFKGAVVDGHQYVQQALDNGAAAAMVEYLPANVDPARLILVNDCKKALVDLALYNRKHTKAKIIAITGSVGKTSTKELTYQAFSALGKSFMTSGNYNNELGLPITMASIPWDCRYAILEMGMSGFGEISYLSHLARPHVAIITNIAGVHLEFFQSVAEIAKAKAEIFEGLVEDGTAILNCENEFFADLVNYAKQSKVSNIITYGKSGDSFVISAQPNQGNTAIVANIMGEEVRYILGSYGNHHVQNSLAALSAVQFLGGDLSTTAHALANFSNLKGRGQILNINFAGKKLTLVDDSYNASPASVAAALNSVGSCFKNARRTVAILADMRELGNDSVALHQSLAEIIVANKIDKIVAVGEQMKHLFQILPTPLQLAHYEDYQLAIDNLADYLENEDLVLVKGSFGTKIHKLVDYLQEKQS